MKHISANKRSDPFNKWLLLTLRVLLMLTFGPAGLAKLAGAPIMVA